MIFNNNTPGNSTNSNSPDSMNPIQGVRYRYELDLRILENL